MTAPRGPAADEGVEEIVSASAADAGVSAVTQRGAVASLSFMTREQQDREAEDGVA